jgi:hypothetical protein
VNIPTSRFVGFQTASHTHPRARETESEKEKSLQLAAIDSLLIVRIVAFEALMITLQQMQ